MSGPTRVLVVGDLLLDADVHGSVSRVCPDAPAPVLDVERRDERPGGAGLAARLLAREGVAVTLATALADDDAAARLRALLAGDGVHVLALGPAAATRTLTRVRSGGHSLVRIDTAGSRIDASAPVDGDALRAALAAADAVLVADYGGGVAAHPVVRDLLAGADAPVVWDPHPRGPDPVPGVRAATPNRSEVERVVGAHRALDESAGLLRARWGTQALVATDGARGAFAAVGDGPALFVPAVPVEGADPCGAGDRFAGTLALALGSGADLPQAVTDAVRDVGAWLAAGGVGAAAPAVPGVGPAAPDADPVAAVRAGGGTVVATGGCFDVVHAGHVASLEAARRLGDCLVVLVNSDESVRRLKGPGRPVHTAEDRRRVLEGLGCVDAVVVFDEDDPSAALARLRPDVWAKGGDYAGRDLPEAPLVASWGGRVVLLPYLPGRSTTRILTHTRPDATPQQRKAAL